MLYVGLDLSRKRIDFDALLASGERFQAAAEARGERIVLWSVDPRDWQPGVSSAQVARSVLRAVRPGSIVILHDGAAAIAAPPCVLCRRSFKGIRRRGLKLVAVSVT